MFARSSSSSSSEENGNQMSLGAIMDEIANEMAESSDEEEIIQRAMREQLEENARMGVVIGESSRPRRSRRYTNRDRVTGGIRLYNDYFAKVPTYNSVIFRRRFRMQQSLFEEILTGVQGYDDYFTQKTQCTGQLGLTPYQKMTAALRLLANGCAADSVDEYIRIGETTTYKCLQRFCRAVIAVFAPEHLREPNAADIAMLLEENAERGFPGMIGSVDCMHWKWKNCPKGWAGAYSGYKGYPSIILEAVASKDLRFWHMFFGMPGSCNDINVINQSGIFDRVVNGESPPVAFVVNGTQYQLPYYLGDGIYPKLATIVKTIPQPRTPKERLFARNQESVRKDVERAFGVFQARCVIICQPAMSWSKEQLHDIMVACVVLHNMILQDERELEPVEYDQSHAAEPMVHPIRTYVGRYQERVERYAQIRNPEMHYQLRGDLVEHMWFAAGNN